MQITIISVGNIKKKYLKEAIDDYSKRISKFSKINHIVIKDESNDLAESEVLLKEGQKILSKIDEQSYLFVLDINGKMLTSIDLSKKLDEIKLNSFSKITFIIGGSMGVHEEVKNKADYLLSFSQMTFPHQLFKIMLLEQIYRTFKISHGHKYHK